MGVAAGNPTHRTRDPTGVKPMALMMGRMSVTTVDRDSQPPSS